MDIIISISFISSAKVHPRVTGGKRKENGEEEKRGGRGGRGVGVGGAGGGGGGGGRRTGQSCNKYEKNRQ